MIKLEFVKFGNAVSVAGQNLLSANSMHYDIFKDEMEFMIRSKRAPEMETWVGLTNVSEYRKSKSLVPDAPKPKAKKES